MQATEPHAAVACAHCGLPVPHGLVVATASAQFCCAGCRAVRDLLTTTGFDRYYALRMEEGAAGRPAQPTGRSYDEMDDPGYQAGACRKRTDGLAEVEWVLEGVHCAACVWLVERLPRVEPALVEARLDLPRSRVRLLWDPSKTPLSVLARRFDAFGYVPHPFRAGRAEAARRADERRMLVRLGVTGAAAANVMAIAFALWGGILNHGMEPAYDAYFRWASLLITLPAIVYGGAPFFRGAWNAMRTRSLHMDVPVVVGVTGAFLHGAVNTVRVSGPVYFDAVTAVLFLLLAGRFVQTRQQRRAGDAANMLASLAPSSARLLDGDAVREVPIETLLPGMVVEVRSGDTFPADGVVTAGRSSIDLALLTGESRPVEAGPGDAVHAGTVNLGARLTVRVDATGEATRVGKLLRLVEEHASRRAPMTRLADRIAGVFVGAVLALAAATGLLWARIDPSRAFDNAFAVLVITCPCALGLATPLAFGAAVGQAARRGILVKGGDVLERLARGGRVWLDKTGTLTEGTLSVVAWEGDPDLRPLVACLEAQSSHVAAAALAADVAAPSGATARDVMEVRGGGIAGTVLGRRLAVGTASFVASRGAAIPETFSARAQTWASRGLTPILIAEGGRVRAGAALGAPLRPDAERSVARLRELGFRPGLLSGDHPAAVAAAAAALGVTGDDARGGVAPEDKLATVTLGSPGETVVMVGDGVNDAAALAAASVGIAVHGGAEAALEAADVFVSRPGVAPVVELVEGARRTMAVVRRNLAFSLVYNSVGVSLAMAGLVDPIVAAALMPASSLTVILSSYRSRMFPPGTGERP